MNIWSPVLRLDVGGAEVFREIRGPVLVAGLRTAPMDTTVIASALPVRRRWNLRILQPGGPSAGRQLGNSRAAIAVVDQDSASQRQWLAALLAETTLPVIPVGVRGAFAVGGVREIARRGLQEAVQRSRVAVRFGRPLAIEDGRGLDELSRACAQLVAEDETTWWQSLTSTEPPASKPTTWRETWERTGPMPRGGGQTRRRIWE